MQRIGRDDQTVEGAETFAAFGVGVVKSARNGSGHAITQRRARGRDAGASGEADRRKQVVAPGKFLRLRQFARLSGPDRLDILARVDTQEFRHRRRRRLDQLDLRKTSDRIRHESELVHWHYMVTNRRSESGMIVRRDHAEDASAGMGSVGGQRRINSSSGGNASRFFSSGAMSCARDVTSNIR